jgi:hypothetical protein
MALGRERMAHGQRRPRQRASTISALAAAALAMLAAGCGGGGEKAAKPSITTAPARSQASDPAARAAYIRRGDNICREFRTRRGTLLPQLNHAARAKDAAALARVLRRIAAYSANAYREFAMLRKPKGDEPTLNSYLALEQQLTGTLKRAAAAYQRGDVRAGTAIIDAQPTLPDRARKIATAYGFTVCGSA